jgi:hypothetical protein
VLDPISDRSVGLNRKVWQLRRGIRESDRLEFTSRIRITQALNVWTCLNKVATVCRKVNSGPPVYFECKSISVSCILANRRILPRKTTLHRPSKSNRYLRLPPLESKDGETGIAGLKEIIPKLIYQCFCTRRNGNRLYNPRISIIVSVPLQGR